MPLSSPNNNINPVTSIAAFAFKPLYQFNDDWSASVLLSHTATWSRDGCSLNGSGFSSALGYPSHPRSFIIPSYHYDMFGLTALWGGGASWISKVAYAGAYLALQRRSGPGLYGLRAPRNLCGLPYHVRQLGSTLAAAKCFTAELDPARCERNTHLTHESAGRRAPLTTGESGALADCSDA